MLPADADIIDQECLKHTCDLFRPKVNPNSDGGGTPGGRGWDIIARGLPYMHDPTRNFSEPSIGGRTLQPSSISVELGWFLNGDASLIHDQDVIRHTTVGGALTGSAYRVLGAVTAFDGIPDPAAASSYIELRQEPHEPLNLPA